MKYMLVLLSIWMLSVDLYAANTVEMLIGSAVVQPSGASSWQKVVNGQKIRIGDTIQTGAQSYVVIDTNGNTIKIQAKNESKIHTGYNQR